MKKLITGIIIGSALTASTAVAADTTLQKIEAYLNPSLPITLDGTKLELQNPPITYNGTTYLPLRDFATTFNKDVNWNDSTKTVELGSKAVSVNSDSIIKERGNIMSDLQVIDEHMTFDNDNKQLLIDSVPYVSLFRTTFNTSLFPVETNLTNKTISFANGKIIYNYVDNDISTYYAGDIFIKKSIIDKITQDLKGMQ
ncbi:copper amine oxidase N-terminal domain-containing protein [Paenibacillus oryzisoli]|uniref:stalk domain-containing protein n=1 Tax=Paenibacillus oryzisoli TaxID=1850517 RepID=UPI003D2830C0